MTEHDLFADRIVTIYVSFEGKRGRGMILENCSVRTIGQRDFVVGTALAGRKGEYSWVVGVEAAFAVDSIISMHFMTRAQYEEGMRRA